MLSLTTPITYSNNVSPVHGYLHHCKTFLSTNFNGRKVRVIGQEHNGTLILDKRDVASSHLNKFSQLLMGVLKIMGWMTLILPLLAYIGARIFHASNRFSEVLQNNNLSNSQVDDPRIPTAPPLFPESSHEPLSLCARSVTLVDASQKPIDKKSGGSLSLFPEEYFKNATTPLAQLDSLEAPFIIEEPLTTKEKLEAYVHEYHPNMPFSQTVELVALGIERFQFLKQWELAPNKTEMPCLKKNENLQRIVAGMAWYCMSLAISKGMGFKEGSFMIPDPNRSFYTFLNGLNETYERISSHLKKHTPKMHAGIDIEEFPLPGGAKHLLFAPVTHRDGSNWIFIKPEEHGTKGAGALIAHTFGWLQSVGRLYLPSVFGSNEEVGVYKERIPEETVTEFHKLVHGLPGGVEAIKTVGEKGSGEGLSAMNLFITTYLSDEGSALEIREQLRAFKEEQIDRYDNEDVRIGREVILERFWKDL